MTRPTVLNRQANFKVVVRYKTCDKSVERVRTRDRWLTIVVNPSGVARIKIKLPVVDGRLPVDAV
ncbi:hypothetical protein [Nostoc sp. WHI]|uniref:hypothetical protein n=1 Tax=Nostoc sp. WHI TaxID=2650611 RepID=UPI0018C5ECA4|nr:hypothetical protein [Nostoc sp. WHI]MBG1265878.1 hypothetical protein [Nostoc sp. WHI]